MLRVVRIAAVMVALLPSLLFARSATAERSMIDLGTLGGHETNPTDINDLGQVSGWGSTDNGEVHPFVWAGGTMLDLGGHFGRGYGINARGQAVGFINSDASAYTTHAFVWQHGKMTLLPTLGGRDGHAYDINNNGDVVGYAQLSTPPNQVGQPIHAALWRNDRVIDLGHLGGGYSTAYAVNDRGQIVGISTTAGDQASHATLWQNGAIRDLGTLGGEFSVAQDINNLGQVIGWSLASENAAHYFLWEDGKMRDMNSLVRGVNVIATGMNDRGQIVGTRDGKGFVWQDGRVTDLGAISPADINNRGQIVGTRWVPGSGQRAFLLNP